MLERAIPSSTLLRREADTRSRARMASFLGMMNVSIMFVSPLRCSRGKEWRVSHSNERALDESRLCQGSDRKPKILGGILV